MARVKLDDDDDDWYCQARQQRPAEAQLEANKPAAAVLLSKHWQLMLAPTKRGGDQW